MRAPGKLVNSIKKMLSLVSMKMDVGGETLWINRGEIQCSMLSADLFNIYIDDLIQLLEKAGLKPLSYVDDLPGICDGDENLINAIDIYEKWAGINDI